MLAGSHSYALHDDDWAVRASLRECAWPGVTREGCCEETVTTVLDIILQNHTSRYGNVAVAAVRGAARHSVPTWSPKVIGEPRSISTRRVLVSITSDVCP